MTEFRKFPSIPRLRRDCTITEKIDGTNACVVVEEHQFGVHVDGVPDGVTCIMGAPLPEDHPQYDGLPDREYLVYAQSRNRLITPDDDNHGFASWVQDNALELYRTLGRGYHYGEWWGSGINRGYGLTGGEKRFSLFNVHKWGSGDSRLWSVPGLNAVPKLFAGPFTDHAVNTWSDFLRDFGSAAAHGFMNPEGIIVYHHAARQYFKYTLDGDGHKGG